MLPKRKRIRLDSTRYAESARVFSIIIGTSPRCNIFSDLAFGHECIELLNALSHHKGNPVFAYCLMPDHVHLLIGVSPASPLVSFVAAWKSQCHKAHRRRGTARRFWQRSFYDHALREQEALIATVHYILNNPVRRKLVADYRQYPLCGSFEYEV
jgi:REP element-mobilizing transposase RayT